VINLNLKDDSSNWANHGRISTGSTVIGLDVSTKYIHMRRFHT